MNHETIFANIKHLSPTLTQIQVDSINAILEACEQHGVTDARQVCYVLATCYHEARFKPVEEVGKGSGRDYGKHLDIGGGPGKRVPYTKYDKLYYGRGFVQITWLSNYKTFGNLLNLDLASHPELALQIDTAAQIIVIGMQKGMFTGKKLADYFNNEVTQPINARKIVNGQDKADLIAGYYEVISKCLI